MKLHLIKHELPEGEYFNSHTPKDTIFLHHTAGSHRPDWAIDWWNKDRTKSGNKIRVGTSFVIGGKSTRNSEDSSYDGKIYQAFDPVYWAHHLGLKSRKNTFLNQKSIGIEICNYGPLSISNDGRFYTYVKTEVPENMVVELEDPFRGYSYYHRYTDSQIDSLRSLILHLSKEFDIDTSKGIKNEIKRSSLKLPKGLGGKEMQRWLNKNGFRDSKGNKLSEDGIIGKKTNEAISQIGEGPLEIKNPALEGYPGIWSHSNVRRDKFDIFPQPEMLEMLSSL